MRAGGDRKAETFRAAVARLRSRCPPLWPVSIRRPHLRENRGTCRLSSKGKPRFTIEVDSGLPANEAIDVLIHEWGHALSWTSEHPDVADHGPEFGLGWARAYRAVFEP